MTALSISLRWAIVISWLALLSWHIIHVSFPDMGLARTFDISAAMTANIDRIFRYDLRRSSTKKSAAPIAQCTLTLAQEDARYRSTTAMTIANLDDLQSGLNSLLGLFLKVPETEQVTGANISVSHIMDARFRLIAMEANGALCNIEFSGKGSVDNQGLHGRYRLGAGEWTPIEIPTITPDITQSSDLAMNLPPRLKKGDVFSSRMLHADPVQMTARTVIGVFTVTDIENITIAHMSIACVRVSLVVDNRPTAIMWADQEGVVYRILHSGTGMTMDLNSITAVTGGTIWPQPLTHESP